MSPRLTETLRQKPVASFLAITFLVSYLAGIPFNVLASALMLPPLDRGVFPRIVTVAGPAIAAALVIAHAEGRDALRAWLATLRIGRAQLPLALGAASVLLACTVTAYMIAGVPLRHLGAWLADAPGTFATALAAQVLVVGVGEELGWRGWLLPTLAKRLGFARATTLTTLVWIAWHAPVFLTTPVNARAFLALIAALGVAFAWLRVRTDSVGAVALAHGTVNVGLGGFEPLATTPQMASAALSWLAALCVLVTAAVIAWDLRRRRTQDASSDSATATA